jgi:hypothetical protein
MQKCESITHVQSIIAIHGLGTASPGTWLKTVETTSPNSGQTITSKINWLSAPNMLPATAPNARIWTFNYNSRWYFDAPAQRILPLSETLLSVVGDMREKASVLVPKDILRVANL